MRWEALAALALVTVPAASGAAAQTGPSLHGETALVPPDLPGTDPVPDPPLAIGAGSSEPGDIPDEYRRDTSSYMIGTVYARTIFLESNGSEEPETENWTLSRKGDVLTGIRDGLTFWEDEAPARLDFQAKASGTTVETGVEPIRHSSYTSGDDCVTQMHWIQDAMEELGYDAPEPDCGEAFDWDIFQAVRDYTHDLRNLKDTDWAYVIFVVDSHNDGDGRFADGTFAYAYLSGPFTVVTYDNDGWGIGNMDKVAAHETGHIFGATDEYNGESEEWGYLWETDNDGSNCLMDDNSWCLSSGTQRQIGWRDSDGDGLEDPIDTRPDTFVLDGPGAYTNESSLAFAGAAEDVPYPAAQEFRNIGYHNISVNDVTDVSWTVDGGAESSTSVDLADPHSAPWSLETDPLSDGTHEVAIWTGNQVGGEDPFASVHDVTVDTTPPATEILHPQPGRIYYAGIAHSNNVQDPEGDADPLVTGNVLYVSATADDDLAPISHVDVRIDGRHVTRLDDRPYDVWIVLHPLLSGYPGPHTLTVEAFDAGGNAATDSQVYVVPPDPASPDLETGGATASLPSPAADATVVEDGAAWADAPDPFLSSLETGPQLGG